MFVNADETGAYSSEEKHNLLLCSECYSKPLSNELGFGISLLARPPNTHTHTHTTLFRHRVSIAIEIHTVAFVHDD